MSALDETYPLEVLALREELQRASEEISRLVDERDRLLSHDKAASMAAKINADRIDVLERALKWEKAVNADLRALRK